MSGNLLIQAEFLALPNDTFGDSVLDIPDCFKKAAISSGLDFKNIRVWLSQYRIGILVEGIRNFDIESVKEIRGPKVSVAYDYNNQPTPALTGFLAAQKLEAKDLVVKEVNGESFLFAVKTVTDSNPERKLLPLKEALMSAVPFAITSWSSESVLPEPLINFTFMFDSKLIEVEFEGVKSSNYILDRRNGVMKRVILKDVSEYEGIMEEFCVYDSPEKRMQHMLEGVAKALPENIRMCSGSFNYTRRADLFESVYPFCIKFNEEFLSINDAVINDVVDVISDYAVCEDTNGSLVNNVVCFLNSQQPDELEFVSRANMLNEYMVRLSNTWNSELERVGKICRQQFPEEKDLSKPLEIIYNNDDDYFFVNALAYASELCGAPDVYTLRSLIYLMEVVKRTKLVRELPLVLLAAVIGFLKSGQADSLPSYVDKSKLVKTVSEIRDFAVGKSLTVTSITVQVFLMAFLVILMHTKPSFAVIAKKRICELVVSGNIKFDLFDYLGKTDGFKVFKEREWLKEIGLVLLGNEYKEYLTEEFLCLSHIDIVSLKEAIPEWRKSTGKSLSELSELAKQIKKIISDYKPDLTVIDDDKLGLELTVRLSKLENKKEIDYIALYSFFITEKINIEAYLSEVTSCLSKSEKDYMPKISVLYRIYESMAKLPFVKK